MYFFSESTEFVLRITFLIIQSTLSLFPLFLLCFVVPPLEGFVMNRVLGDYFETLLYKIFVSIDEHTSIAEVMSVISIKKFKTAKLFQ